MQCKSCRRPLLPEAANDSAYCDRPECQTRRKVEASAKLAQSKQEQNAAWFALTEKRTEGVIRAAAEESGQPDLDMISYGLAPYVDLPLVPQPEVRRRDFAAHLRAIIAESFSATEQSGEPPAEPEDDPGYKRRRGQEEPDPMALNAACIACQGDCCLQGGTRHAFLKKPHIDYVRWCAPEAEAEEILEIYLSHLPDQSISGSCLYHGEFGCTLPRGLRANICNSFQCRFRLKLLEDYIMKPGSGAVVAGISRDHVDDPNAGAPYLRVVSVTDEGDVTIHSHLKLPALPSPEGRDGS
ncbi:MAG: hypothetical protein HKN30_09400 [Sulfitobacter sp.]|nr:hypothetical protein [Sulfitobacter sp.]